MRNIKGKQALAAFALVGAITLDAQASAPRQTNSDSSMAGFTDAPLPAGSSRQQALVGTAVIMLAGLYNMLQRRAEKRQQATIQPVRKRNPAHETDLHLH